MIFNDILKINLPDSFPTKEYTKFMDTAKSVLLSPKGDAWKEFAGASNLIGWRYRACHEYKEFYITSWISEGSKASFETIYNREKALFGMFTSGVSCIESICYAIYALASHEKSLGLPFSKTEQRNCTLKGLHEKLLEFTCSSNLVKALSDIIDSMEWNLWIDFRNRMFHRANLPRIIHGAMGSSPPPAKAFEFAATSSTPAIDCDEDKIEELCSWLSNSVSSLLSGGCDLVPDV